MAGGHGDVVVPANACPQLINKLKFLIGSGLQDLWIALKESFHEKKAAGTGLFCQ